MQAIAKCYTNEIFPSNQTISCAQFLRFTGRIQVFHGHCNPESKFYDIMYIFTSKFFRMKKGIFFLCLLASVSFVSCKKCMTCKLAAGSADITYPDEKCGTKKQLDDFEKLYKERALESGTVGARAVCTTK